MSIGSILNMARAGMNAQQLAIQVTSQNISNADTQGYSKQRVELATTLPTVFPYGSVGTGVDVKTITRARDAMLDASYRSNTASKSQSQAMATALTQIQSIFGEPSDNGLGASLDAFWSSWDNLANDPTNSAAKSAVLEAGTSLATTLNGVAKQIDQIDQNNRESMNADVDQANSIAQQIASYNKQIVAAEAGGQPANDLRDARDNLLDQYSDLVGGQVVQRANGSVGVYIAGRLVVDAATAKPLQMNDGQPPYVSFAGSTEALSGISGQLGGEIDLSTKQIPSVMAKLDALAKGVVQSVNAIHSTGTTFMGNPPVAGAATNFFQVTNPPPAGVDPFLTARGITVALTNASQVAASGAGATGPGDNATASALAGLRTTSVTITDASGATLDTDTLPTFYSSIVSDVATSTKQANDDSAVQTTLTSNVDAQRQSVSGVSTDEELINLIQHQHSYQAAARLVSTVSDMLDTLVQLGQ